MKLILTRAAAAALIVLAGCGVQTTSAASPSTAPAPSSHAATTPNGASLARADERLFAQKLANHDEAALLSTVAGSVMRNYLREQTVLDAAEAEAGSAPASNTVSTIPGGYRLCWTDSSGNTQCNSFTGFRTNASGRITDAAVDGQLISSRLGAGTSSRGSQLAITSVNSYLPTTVGKVVITFQVRDISSRPAGNGSPAFLAAFDTEGGSRFSEDDTYSALPSTLQPGESVAAYAVFDTRAITGQFSLRTNDQLMQVLAATHIHALSGPPPQTGTNSKPSASAAATVTFGCKVLQTSTGEEFNVTTVSGGSYRGTIHVSFHDYPGSGDTFPDTTVDSATSTGAWHKMPAADIGASAEPSGCTASAG